MLKDSISNVFNFLFSVEFLFGILPIILYVIIPIIMACVCYIHNKKIDRRIDDRYPPRHGEIKIKSLYKNLY